MNAEIMNIDESDELSSEESVYGEIADELLKAIQKDDLGNWQCPWHGFAKMPTNPFTGREYKGSNVLKLWSASKTRKYESNFWAGVKTWQDNGGEVDIDQGVSIFIPVHGQVPIEWDKTSDPAVRKRLLGEITGAEATGGTVRRIIGFKRGVVYSQDAVTGARVPPAGKAVEFNPIDAAERVIQGYLKNKGPALKHGGGKAYYVESLDIIHMPEREAFPPQGALSGAQFYYATLIHESIHSTGNSGRLDRNLRSNDKKRYAKEELVAEIGSSFLCATLGLATELRQSHAQYIKNWMESLSKDKKVFIIAVKNASRAVDYILMKSKMGSEIDHVGGLK